MRRWTRLAYWYPARSAAAGVYGYPTAFGDTHILDFTEFGAPTDAPTGVAAGQEKRCSQMATYPDNYTLKGLHDFLTAHKETHNYLLNKPFFKVWEAYYQIWTKLKKE